jgi:serine/threonine protein kinase
MSPAGANRWANALGETTRRGGYVMGQARRTVPGVGARGMDWGKSQGGLGCLGNGWAAGEIVRLTRFYNSQAMSVVAEPGDTLKGGRYQIERLLRKAPGKGVYLAQDHVLDCTVVVDVSPVEAVAARGSAAWEARVLGRLGDHPNIAFVIDYWQDSESSYMVSRYLSGGSLQDAIEAAKAEGEPIPVERVLRYALQLARALEHIHGCRIVYRDLQPRNVLLDSWGTLRLVDFDTAVSLDDHDQPPISDGRSIEHMAPEVAAGDSPDERGDLYSLGTTIVAMCEGHASGTTEERPQARPMTTPELELSDLPEGLKELVSELLAPNREDRPASAAAVVRRLDELLTAEKELEGLLASDETATLEFKATLRTPVGPRPPGDTRTSSQLGSVLEDEVLKTIAGFLNTQGGTLVIGVDDDKAIVGIEIDYLRTGRSRDGWRRTLDQLISHQLGPNVLRSIDLQLAPCRGKTVAIIRCEARDQPTWLHRELFVRRTASTEMLSTEEAWAWCQERWRSSI